MPRTATQMRREIRASLRNIARSLAQIVSTLRRHNRAGRRLKLSPKRRAQLKLQGLYMGCVRNLAAKQKGRVKALRAKKGYGPAIVLAKKLAQTA